MIGTDFEHTFSIGNETTGIIPALVAFQDQTVLPMQEVEKDYGLGPFRSLEFIGKISKVTEDGLAYEVPGNPGWSEDVLKVLGEGIRNAKLIANELGLIQSVAPKVTFRRTFSRRPELMIFGCSPDMSIHEQGIFRPPMDARRINWRTTGGHIHFSCENVKSFRDQQALILGCDMILGLADVLLEHSKLGKERRELYGQPGKFRIQPWGVEYRTPTAVWTVHPEPALEFLKLAEQVHRKTDEGISWFDVERNVNFESIIQCIVACDHETAEKELEEVCKVCGIELPNFFVDIAHRGGIKNTYGYKANGWENVV